MHIRYIAVLVSALSLAGCSYLPLGVDPGADIRVLVRPEYIELRPNTAALSDTGLIFYPGGLVDPLSYVESLSVFSRLGYVVIILRAPANLAIINSNQAVSALSAYASAMDKTSTAIPSSWVGAGHSLGGTSAAFLIADKPEFFKALVLMASYPADSSSLSAWTGKVISISASEDGLATPDKIQASVSLLPADTVYHPIPGGCHAQFGNYGVQDGDGIPVISASAQWQEMADIMDDFLTDNGWDL